MQASIEAFALILKTFYFLERHHKGGIPHSNSAFPISVKSSSGFSHAVKYPARDFLNWQPIMTNRAKTLNKFKVHFIFSSLNCQHAVLHKQLLLHRKVKMLLKETWTLHVQHNVASCPPNG